MHGSKGEAGANPAFPSGSELRDKVDELMARLRR